MKTIGFKSISLSLCLSETSSFQKKPSCDQWQLCMAMRHCRHWCTTLMMPSLNHDSWCNRFRLTACGEESTTCAELDCLTHMNIQLLHDDVQFISRWIFKQSQTTQLHHHLWDSLALANEKTTMTTTTKFKRQTPNHDDGNCSELLLLLHLVLLLLLLLVLLLLLFLLLLLMAMTKLAQATNDQWRGRHVVHHIIISFSPMQWSMSKMVPYKRQAGVRSFGNASLLDVSRAALAWQTHSRSCLL